MSYKPILIVPGDPDSIFFEIFFKIIKIKKIKSPIFLVCSCSLLNEYINKYKIKVKIQEIKIMNLKEKNISKKD